MLPLYYYAEWTNTILPPPSRESNQQKKLNRLGCWPHWIMRDVVVRKDLTMEINEQVDYNPQEETARWSRWKLYLPTNKMSSSCSRGTWECPPHSVHKCIQPVTGVLKTRDCGWSTLSAELEGLWIAKYLVQGLLYLWDWWEAIAMIVLLLLAETGHLPSSQNHCMQTLKRTMLFSTTLKTLRNVALISIVRGTPPHP